MLFFFQGRYSTPARILIGIALLVIGLVTHTAFATAVGAVLAAWGVSRVVSGRRCRPGSGAGRWTRS